MPVPVVPASDHRHCHALALHFSNVAGCSTHSRHAVPPPPPPPFLNFPDAQSLTASLDVATAVDTTEEGESYFGKRNVKRALCVSMCCCMSHCLTVAAPCMQAAMPFGSAVPFGSAGPVFGASDAGMNNIRTNRTKKNYTFRASEKHNEKHDDLDTTMEDRKSGDENELTVAEVCVAQHQRRSVHLASRQWEACSVEYNTCLHAAAMA